MATRSSRQNARKRVSSSHRPTKAGTPATSTVDIDKMRSCWDEPRRDASPNPDLKDSI